MLPNRTAPLSRGQLSSRVGTLGNPQQRLKGQISQHNNLEQEQPGNTSGYNGYFEEQRSLEDLNEGYLRNEMKRDNSKRFLVNNQLNEESGKQPMGQHYSSKQTENRIKQDQQMSEETQILRRRGLRDQLNMQEFQEDEQVEEDINRNSVNCFKSTTNNYSIHEQSQDKKMLAIITLQIGEGNDQIVVNQGDDISDLAKQFCRKHQLEQEWEYQIAQIISENLQKKIQSRNQRKINSSQMEQDVNTLNASKNPNDTSYNMENNQNNNYQVVTEPLKMKSNINNTAKSSKILGFKDEHQMDNLLRNQNQNNKITFNNHKSINSEWSDDQRYYQQQQLHCNERKNSESPKFPSVPQVSEHDSKSIQQQTQQQQIQQSQNITNKRRQQQPSFGEMHFFEVSKENNQEEQDDEYKCEQIVEGEESSEESSLHQTNTTAGGGHSINQSSFYENNNNETQQQYPYYRENPEQGNDKRSYQSKPQQQQQLNLNQHNKAQNSNNNQNTNNRSFVDVLNHKTIDNNNKNPLNLSSLQDDYSSINNKNSTTTQRKILDSNGQNTQREQYLDRQKLNERKAQINQNNNQNHQDNSNYINDNSYGESEIDDEQVHSVQKQAVVPSRQTGKSHNEINQSQQQLLKPAQSSQLSNDQNIILSDPNHRKNIAQLISKNLHIGSINHPTSNTQIIPQERINILPTNKSHNLSSQSSNPKQQKPQSRQLQSQKPNEQITNNTHLDSSSLAETNTTQKSQTAGSFQENEAEKSYDVWMKLLNQKIPSNNTIRQQPNHQPNKSLLTPAKVNQLLGSPLRNQTKNQQHCQNTKNTPEKSAMNFQIQNNNPNRNSQIPSKQSNNPDINTHNHNTFLGPSISPHSQNYSTQSAQTNFNSSSQFQDLSPRTLGKNKSTQMLRTPNSNHLASPQASTHRSRVHGAAGGSKERTSRSPSSKHVLKADESKAIMFQQAQIHRDQLKLFLDTKTINPKGEVRGSSTSRNNQTNDNRELTPRRVAQQKLDEQRLQQLLVPMQNIRKSQNIQNNSFIGSSTSNKGTIVSQTNRQSTPTRQLKTLADQHIQLSPSGTKAPLSSRNCITPSKDNHKQQGTLSNISKQQQLRPNSKDKMKSTALQINSNNQRNPNPEPTTPRRQQANFNVQNNQRTPNKDMLLVQYQPQIQQNKVQQQHQQQTSQKVNSGSLKGKLHPSLQRKLGQLFKQFDSDNDGLISSIEIDISSTDAELLVIIQNALYEIEEQALTLNSTQFIALLQQHNLIDQLQQYFTELEGEGLCEVEAMLAEMNNTNRCIGEKNGFQGVDEINYQKMVMDQQGNQNNRNGMKSKSNMRGNLIENKENSYYYEDTSQNQSYSHNNNNRISDNNNNNMRIPQQRQVQQQQQHAVNKYVSGYY